MPPSGAKKTTPAQRKEFRALKEAGLQAFAAADFATCVEVFGKALDIKADDAEVQEALAFAKRQLA